MSEQDLPLFAWSPPRPAGELVLFPTVKRKAFVSRTVTRLLSYPLDRAEKDLQTTLKVQRTAMERKGLPADVIDKDLRAFERQCRIEMLRHWQRGEGA